MEVTPYITPPDTCLSPLIFIPSDDAEIHCFELYTGQLIQRFHGMERNINGRVTCITGRPTHHVCPHLLSPVSYLLSPNFADGEELYSGAVDADVGVWQSNLIYRPFEKSSVNEKTLEGQEMLRDIYNAFVGVKSELRRGIV